MFSTLSLSSLLPFELGQGKTCAPPAAQSLSRVRLRRLPSPPLESDSEDQDELPELDRRGSYASSSTSGEDQEAITPHHSPGPLPPLELELQLEDTFDGPLWLDQEHWVDETKLRHGSQDGAIRSRPVLSPSLSPPYSSSSSTASSSALPSPNPSTRTFKSDDRAPPHEIKSGRMDPVRPSRPTREEEESRRGRARWPRLLYASKVDSESLAVLEEYFRRTRGRSFPRLDRTRGQSGANDWNRALNSAGL